MSPLFFSFFSFFIKPEAEKKRRVPISGSGSGSGTGIGDELLVIPRNLSARRARASEIVGVEIAEGSTVDEEEDEDEDDADDLDKEDERTGETGTSLFGTGVGVNL